MSFTDLLIDLCDILRYYPAATVDEYGQPQKSWAATQTNVACRLTQPSNREIQTNMEVVLIDKKLFFDGDVDVTERDRIVSGGVTYEIVSVTKYRGLVPSIHTEVQLKAVS